MDKPSSILKCVFFLFILGIPFTLIFLAVVGEPFAGAFVILCMIFVAGVARFFYVRSRVLSKCKQFKEAVLTSELKVVEKEVKDRHVKFAWKHDCTVPVRTVGYLFNKQYPASPEEASETGERILREEFQTKGPCEAHVQDGKQAYFSFFVETEVTDYSGFFLDQIDTHLIYGRMRSLQVKLPATDDTLESLEQQLRAVRLKGELVAAKEHLKTPQEKDEEKVQAIARRAREENKLEELRDKKHQKIDADTSLSDMEKKKEKDKFDAWCSARRNELSE